MGSGIWVIQFSVRGLGFRMIRGLWVRIRSSISRVYYYKISDLGSGLRIYGSGCRAVIFHDNVELSVGLSGDWDVRCGWE